MRCLIAWPLWPTLLLATAAAACSRSPMPAVAAGTTSPSTVYVEAEPGERHLSHIRQLTFGGNNAEAYFSPDGERLIFQRQESVSAGCDQEFVMKVDGSGMQRVSNGLGRTTCGYFYDGRPAHSLQLHLRALARVPASSRLLPGLRLGTEQSGDLHGPTGRQRSPAPYPERRL